MRSTRGRAAVRWGVTIALVILVVRYVDLGETWQTVLSVDPKFLLLACLAALADRFLMIVKWKPLLDAQELGISLKRTVRVYFAASFAGIFLPASIGGDLLRALAIGGDRGAVAEVGASIAVERLLGLAAAAALTLIALGIALSSSIQLEFVVPWAIAALVAAATILTAALSPRAYRATMAALGRLPSAVGAGLLQRFASGVAAYRSHRPTLLWVTALTLVEQAFPILILWLIGLGMEADITLRMLVVAVPLTMFLARLPVAINGLGLLEGSLIYLLGLFGVESATALSAAVIWRAAVLIASLPGAFFWEELSTAAHAVRLRGASRMA